MLLRSVIKHVGEQNWAAVVIDFVIVVVGVFIGIQVANLNETRIENQQSASFTERLLTDLRKEAWNITYAQNYYVEVLASADRAVSALEGETELSDEALIINAYRATQTVKPLQARATYDELVSIGAINLIRDHALRRLVSRMYSVDLFDNTNEYLSRNSPYRQLFRRIITTRIQRGLLSACGDRPVISEDYSSIENPLDYPCSTNLSEEEIAAAANILRSHPDVLPYLRLRQADVTTWVYDIRNRDWIGQLRELVPDVP